MKEGNATLTTREQRRLTVLNHVGSGALSAKEAAQLLGLSERQLRRLRRSYERDRTIYAHRLACYERRMPTVHFQVETALPPDRVLAVLTDFSDRRPELYGNIDRAHFRVDGQGPGWAEVTEGNVLAWERSRYDWDPSTGLVTVRTIESDSWRPGSRWEYRLRPGPSGGTQVDVTVVLLPRTLRGRLIAIGLPFLGRGVLRRDLEGVLRSSD